MVWRTSLKHVVFAATLAGGLLLSVGARPSRADDDRAECRRNVDRWEDRLNRDIDRHGTDSRQAMHDRHERDEAREACRQKFGDRWRDRDDDRDRHEEHHEYHDNRY